MGKQAALFDLLKRSVGTTIAVLSKASGWQQHSVREFLSRRGPQVARARIGRGIALALQPPVIGSTPFMKVSHADLSSVIHHSQRAEPRRANLL